MAIQIYPRSLRDISCDLRDAEFKEKVLKTETSLIQTGELFSNVLTICKETSERNVNQMLEKPTKLNSSLMKLELGACESDVKQLDGKVAELHAEIQENIGRCREEYKVCTDECDQKAKLMQQTKTEVSQKKDDIREKKKRTEQNERRAAELENERVELKDNQKKGLIKNIGLTIGIAAVSLIAAPFTGGLSLGAGAAVGTANTVCTVIDYKKIDEQIRKVNSTIDNLQREIRMLTEEVRKQTEDIRKLQMDIKRYEKMKANLSSEIDCLERIDMIFTTSIKVCNRVDVIIQDILKGMRDVEMQIDTYEMIREHAASEESRKRMTRVRKYVIDALTRIRGKKTKEQKRREQLRDLLESNHSRLIDRMETLTDICDSKKYQYERAEISNMKGLKGLKWFEAKRE